MAILVLGTLVLLGLGEREIRDRAGRTRLTPPPSPSRIAAGRAADATVPSPKAELHSSVTASPREEEDLPVLEVAHERDRGEVDRMETPDDPKRAGSPTRVRALVESISALPTGDRKEELAHELAAVMSRDSALLLLKTLLETHDETLSRACLTALRKVADGEMVRALAARYEETSDLTDRDRITQVIAGVQNDDAAEALMSLAGREERLPDDPLIAAAERGLATVGNGPAASFLLQRRGETAGDQADRIEQALLDIRRPEARAVFEYAAQGNRDAPTEELQVLAIRALANFPDSDTACLMTRLSAESSGIVQTAARTLLEFMGRPTDGGETDRQEE
ncbi:MAG: hypothetical protein HYY93_16970 [Planctomycetes bacterium]|nr:hypothetical protein [Planctomycetota bacterium]